MRHSGRWYLEQIRAILILPFTVTVVIPLLLWIAFPGWGKTWNAWFLGIALPIGAAGLALFLRTLRLFMGIGDGTLAPWNPPRHLVVAGPYAYVRNPMLSGVFLILFAESLAVQSGAIALWLVIFFLINVLYFRWSEEPGLRRRFGDEYEEYCRNVPRFIPRLTPWIRGERGIPGDRTGT